MIKNVTLNLPDGFENFRGVVCKAPEAGNWHIFDDLCLVTFNRGGKVIIRLNCNKGSEKRSGAFGSKDELKEALNSWKAFMREGDYFILNALNVQYLIFTC